MPKRNKINLEYIFMCSIPMLYKFLTTVEGLRAWYCDNVIIDKNVYTFHWEGEEEIAIAHLDAHQSHFQLDWIDRPITESTKFKISKSPITQETILNISTHCNEQETQEEQLYWDNIITELKHATGG